jgi:catechol 2,3-dioxygenase-like lactoylglutathione lyase family enzyme
MILDISHVALQVPDLDASVGFAVDTLGMQEVECAGPRAYLTHASPYPSLGRACAHHVLEYAEGPHAALDHVGLVVANRADLAAIGVRAEAAGGSIVSTRPEEPGLESAIRIAAPSGHIFEIHTAMETIEQDYMPRGLRPHRLGHVNLLTPDVQALIQFLVEGLGFRVSDWIHNPDGLRVAFLRCHYEHHTLGAAAGPADGLHHIAFETASTAEIGRLGDELARSGAQYLSGPQRHGVGDNIAAYFAGPDGIVIEIYTDMQRIIGDAWEPRTWQYGDPRVANMWSPPADLGPLMEASIPLTAGAPEPAPRG